MIIEKEFSEIAEKWTEPEYRARPELSYSTLARFEREGYDNLDHLFDQISTPALTQGSMLDTLITGSKEEFDTLFYVADFPSIGEKELQIVNSLFNQYNAYCAGFSVIPYDNVLAAANYFEFQKNWKDETRVKVLKERCGEYYNLKYLAGSRTIISKSVYEKVLAMVRALRESPATSGYFADNDSLSPVRRYYQLKFKAELEGVGYRCMADEIIVLYDEKKVIPIDLKSSGHPEWHFEDSFVKWSYFIQSRLYWRLIRHNMDKDSFFKDFTLEDYRFIVVNKDTLTPLVWEFPLTKSYGTLVDEKGNEYRDPFEIGKELRGYLDLRPLVPNGIDRDGVNLIKCLKEKGVEDCKRSLSSL